MKPFQSVAITRFGSDCAAAAMLKLPWRGLAYLARPKRFELRRCGASRLMPSIEIVFETQMLHAAATAPHKLQGLYPDFDMPFDIIRGHQLIRRFRLHTLGHHRLIGHKKQPASRHVACQ